MQPNEEQAVEDVIADFVQKGIMFTAFDITKVMRSDKGLNVYHSDTRDFIRRFWNKGRMDGYGSTLVNLPVSGSPLAFVYHPLTSDPNMYDPNNLVAAIKSADPVGDPVAADPDGTVIRVPDHRQRICVPKEMIDSIYRSVCGRSVNVVAYGPGNRIEVGFETFYDTGADVSVYLIDKSGNVRISPAVSIRAFGSIPNQVKMEVNGHVIEITPA